MLQRIIKIYEKDFVKLSESLFSSNNIVKKADQKSTAKNSLKIKKHNTAKIFSSYQILLQRKIKTYEKDFLELSESLFSSKNIVKKVDHKSTAKNDLKIKKPNTAKIFSLWKSLFFEQYC